VTVWCLSVLPSLLGTVPFEPAFYWADQYNDVPTLGFVVVAAVQRLRVARERKERTFWRLFMGCVAGWIAVRGLYVVVPYEARGVKSDLFSDLSYLVGYLCLVVALELRPDRDPPGFTRVRRVESLGIVTFGFLMLSYFTLAPSVFNPEAYASWSTSLMLYAVLDAWLLVRALRLLHTDLAPEWVVPMRFLAGAMALWLIGDVLEGLMYLEAIPYLNSGTPADLLWTTPMLLLLLVVRSRAWQDRPPPAMPAVRAK
jgi:hypothetical protein